MRVADIEASKRFYTQVLGFQVSEEDPIHGGCFMTLGDNFHTIDVGQHPNPAQAQRPRGDQVGMAHMAFQVADYAALRDAYLWLQAKGVSIHHATDHVSQRSLYFDDPDGNRLEIYYEMPDALTRFSTEERGDRDVVLEVGTPGGPLPEWLHQDWPYEGALVHVGRPAPARMM